MTNTNQNPMLSYDPSEYYSGEAIQVAEAIRSRDYGKLSRLLTNSPSVASSRGNKDIPLLAWAMGHNDPTSFERLLQAGANPNDYLVVQDGRMSLLSIATGADSAEWLELLLRYRANPDGLPDTEPPLFTARYAHKPERFERLLEAGANLNQQDGAGKTVVMVCVIANDYIQALELARRGADLQVRMTNGTTIRKMIERFPLPPNTPQGRAQSQVAAMLAS